MDKQHHNFTGPGRRIYAFALFLGFLYLILFLPVILLGQTQNPPQAHWQIEAGYQHMRLQVKQVSPLIYAANNAFVGGRFLREKGAHHWMLRSSLSLGSNQAKGIGRRKALVYDPYSLNGSRDSFTYDINPALSFIQGTLSASYYRSIRRSEEYAVSIGGIFDHQLIYGAMAADLWFLYRMSLMPSVRLERSMPGEGKLSAEMSIPVLSYLLQPPYALDPSLPEPSYFKAYLKTGSAMSSFQDFQQMNLLLSYEHRLNDQRSIGLNYRFLWTGYADKPVSSINAYSNTVSLFYTF